MSESAGRQWLMPVISVIQQAEIRKILVQCQPKEIVYETLSQKNSITKMDW
jgi:hypothetical protein